MKKDLPKGFKQIGEAKFKGKKYIMAVVKKDTVYDYRMFIFDNTNSKEYPTFIYQLPLLTLNQ